jgi:hypothetical protein
MAAPTRIRVAGEQERTAKFLKKSRRKMQALFLAEIKEKSMGRRGPPAIPYVVVQGATTTKACGNLGNRGGSFSLSS